MHTGCRTITAGHWLRADTRPTPGRWSRKVSTLSDALYINGYGHQGRQGRHFCSLLPTIYIPAAEHEIDMIIQFYTKVSALSARTLKKPCAVRAEAGSTHQKSVGPASARVGLPGGGDHPPRRRSSPRPGGRGVGERGRDGRSFICE